MLLLYDLFFTLAERFRLSRRERGKEKLRISLLNLNEVLVLRKKTQWIFAYKLEKTDAMNRNEFITQDSIKIVNECIVYLEASHLCPEMNTIR